MGVPITYIDKHNPEQFEIVGSSRDMSRPMSEIASEGSYEKGGPRFYVSLDKISKSDIIFDSRQQTADSRQQTADSRQQTADSRQQTVRYKRLYDRIVIRRKL